MRLVNRRILKSRPELPEPPWPVAAFTIDSPDTPPTPVPKLKAVSPVARSVNAELPLGAILGVILDASGSAARSATAVYGVDGRL